MRKFLFIGIATALLTSTYAYAGNREIGFEEFSSDVSIHLGSINRDLFRISDVDGNGKLSRNEITENIKSAPVIEDVSDSDKQRLFKEAIKDFNRFDLDHDSWLDTGEGEAYFQNYQEKTIRKQFDRIDLDHNGFLSDEELNRFYQSKRESVSLDQDAR